MSIVKNPNSILFLYEGETEKEFYDRLFDEYIEPRKIRINFGNLKGVYDLNNKVESKIKTYLAHERYKDCGNIHVFVGYDREGDRNTETLLNLDELNRNFIYKKSRVASINEIVATQDLESWFFNDLSGIYKFLRVPNAQRNMKAYPNCEAVDNRVLSGLFHRHGKHYQKGKRVRNFIMSLDIGKIYENTRELQNAIEKIKSIC